MGFGDDDTRVLGMLQEELQKELIEDPINLRFVDRKRLKSVTAKVYITSSRRSVAV